MSLPAARYDLADPAARSRGLAAAASAVKGGGLVALSLESGPVLLADAFSGPGVRRLRAARRRPDLVPTVLVAGRKMLAGIAVPTASAEDLLAAFWPGALILLLSAQPSLAWDVAPPGSLVPVRMPLSAPALELLDRTGPLAVAPAGAPGQDSQGGGAVARVVLADSSAAGAADGVATVVNAAVEPARLLRAGDFTVAQIRAVCPTLTVGEQEAT